MFLVFASNKTVSFVMATDNTFKGESMMKSQQLNYLMCIILAAGLTACGDDSHEDTAVSS